MDLMKVEMTAGMLEATVSRMEQEKVAQLAILSAAPMVAPLVFQKD